MSELYVLNFILVQDKNIIYFKASSEIDLQYGKVLLFETKAFFINRFM